jgi:dCMP deaminase
LSREVAVQFRPLAKDLRALDPEFIKAAIRAWGVPADVEIADAEVLEALSKSPAPLVMPDEDISHQLAEQYFAGHDIEYSPIFLRWDRRRSEAQEEPGAGQAVSSNPADQALMNRANQESWSSSDIWRRVGALIVRDGQAILHGYNRAQPTDVTPWAEGDPRNNFNKGTAIEMSLFIHAEADLIAQAARDGVALAGASIYVTTFPCPNCAKLIAGAGLAKCYFSAGYSMLDGNRILEASGIETIRVEGKLDDPPEEIWAPYPQDT